MATLRPNGTVSAASWTRTGGTTKHGVLADDSDATYLKATDTTDADFNLTSYTLGAGERVKRIRMRIRARLDAGVVGPHDVTARYRLSGGASATEATFSLSSSTFANLTGAWFTEFLAAGDQQALVDGLRGVVRYPLGVNPGPEVAEVHVDLDVWEAPDAPTVSSDPSGTITDTDVPTIESYTAALNDGTPSLWSRQVRVFRYEVYVAGGFDPATETDVEWEQTDTSLGSISTDSGNPDELQVGDPLANSDTYRAYVRYGKNDVAGETLWSDWDYVEFTLNLTLPVAPTVAVAVLQPEGRQEITVTTAAVTHDTVERLRVERSDDDGATWSTIRDGLLTDVAASSAYTFDDFDAPRGTALSYRASVAEGITASGSTITSGWTTADPVAHPHDGRTWLFDVDTWGHVGPYWTSRGRGRQPAEQQGVFYPTGRRTAVVVTSGRTADSLDLDLFGFDEHGNVEDVEALATYTGKVLVKWVDGTQDYVRVTRRSCDIRDIASDRRRRWSLAAVEVASGITKDG